MMTATTEARAANRFSSQFSTTFHQNSENSKSFDLRSVQRKDAGAGSSVWYERRIRNAEVVGPNPARSTEQLLSGKVLLNSRRCLVIEPFFQAISCIPRVK